jgi:hypothetical protein
MPSLAGVSQLASFILTVLGVVWLVVQIYDKIWGLKKK